MSSIPKVLLTTCGDWYLPHTARAFEARNALAGFWISLKNQTKIPADKYRRCWPFHLAMKPFYHLATPIVTERVFYALFPIWRWWLKRQTWPDCNVVQSIMGFATEPFDRADQTGALKVVDAPNSHPITYYGLPQSEYDVWCPGAKVGIPQWMFARMNRELARADLVLCPSNFVRDTMVNFGVPAEKCFINPFGVDTSVFTPRSGVPEVPRFIIVGSIHLRKGHHYLFRAFQRVKRALPSAELVCVGVCLDDFRREWPRWQGTFIHHPHLSHRELAALLRQCTAFVFPSIEEGFARVIVEAMAAGLPIIASHESGATTLVQDGVEGLIIRPRDVDQIADAMIRLAQDRALNQHLGEAARQRGAERNTWQDYGDRLLAEYERRLELKRDFVQGKVTPI
ncbi:MAG: glycosyltransferase family 4 protein [Verrucomicrobiota bacterium]|jgi:glycosyltransferase involved in cell wall biosynthesis